MRALALLAAAVLAVLLPRPAVAQGRAVVGETLREVREALGLAFA